MAADWYDVFLRVLEQSMKVLVVDDDVVSRMVLMHLIDACGSYEILEAEDGQDAWDQLEGGLRPAILFCDLRMPRLSGMELLERVRAAAALDAMPFVLVTSATERGTVDQATGLGAAGYIVKPFQADQVRVHMAAFSEPAAGGGQRAETPAATMARLGIGAERLLVYLGGFQSQLTGASGEIDAMLARAEYDGARLRIGRLQAGCSTLGLDGAAAAFQRLASGTLDQEQVHVVLADAVHAVMVQSEMIKRLHALP
jgi:two-component system chemotaxis response regulator CheY